MNKCVFLDRDGVLNVERGDYTYRIEDFEIIPGVPEAIEKLKNAGFLIVVVTNQSGISQGIYTRAQMQACHEKLMKNTRFLIDRIYYCPYHPSVTASLARKPGTLMIEKAMARFGIDPSLSWLVGDRPRDIECGKKMALKTILISEAGAVDCTPDYTARDLLTAVDGIILNN